MWKDIWKLANKLFDLTVLTSCLVSGLLASLDQFEIRNRVLLLFMVWAYIRISERLPKE